MSQSETPDTPHKFNIGERVSFNTHRYDAVKYENIPEKLVGTIINFKWAYRTRETEVDTRPYGYMWAYCIKSHKYPSAHFFNIYECDIE